MYRLIACLLGALMFAGGASAATLSFQLETNGGSGQVIDTTVPNGAFDVAFVLVGSNLGSGAAVDTLYAVTAPDPAPKPLWQVTGAWTYLSNDSGGSVFDPFGYVINGEKFQLTDNRGGLSQIGTFSFLLGAGDVFGWYVASLDDSFGAAMATVGANVAPIPIPAALPLLVGGLVLLGAVARRRTDAA